MSKVAALTLLMFWLFFVGCIESEKKEVEATTVTAAAESLPLTLSCRTRTIKKNIVQECVVWESDPNYAECVDYTYPQMLKHTAEEWCTRVNFRDFAMWARFWNPVPEGSE